MWMVYFVLFIFPYLVYVMISLIASGCIDVGIYS
jgi:hypothetical protein